MKWLFFSFIPALYCVGTGAEMTPKLLEIGGFWMLFCFMALFAELETVDVKALDKAGEIVTRGGCKYSPEKSQGVVLFLGIVVVGIHALVSQGGIFTEARFAALTIGGYVLGVWLSPEPDEVTVQKYVEELKKKAAENYMKELKTSDPERYREELGRLKWMESQGMGSLPDDLQADCDRLGVTAVESPLMGFMQTAEGGE